MLRSSTRIRISRNNNLQCIIKIVKIYPRGSGGEAYCVEDVVSRQQFILKSFPMMKTTDNLKKMKKEKNQLHINKNWTKFEELVCYNLILFRRFSKEIFQDYE
jgi:hypothetical protein